MLKLSSKSPLSTVNIFSWNPTFTVFSVCTHLRLNVYLDKIYCFESITYNNRVCIFVEAFGELHTLDIVKEFNCTIEPLPLTSIIAHPYNTQLFIASTSTALLSLATNGECNVLIGVDTNVSDKCNRASSAGNNSFIDIVQVEYARVAISGNYEDLILIVDFLGGAIWRMNLFTNVYELVLEPIIIRTSFTTYTTFLPSHTTKACVDGANADQYFVYLENDVFTKTKTVVANIALKNKRLSYSSAYNTTHYFFNEADADCVWNEVIALHHTLPFTTLEKYVSFNESLVFLDDNGCLYSDGSVIPLAYHNEMGSSVYNKEIGLINEISNTTMVAALNNSNKIALIGEETVSTIQKGLRRYKVLGNNHQCEESNVIRSWFPSEQIEFCLYACGKTLHCGGVGYDKNQHLCQLHMAVAISANVRFHTFCVASIN